MVSAMNIDTTQNKRSVLIRTPDQHLRVFVSSTLNELADERKAVREALTKLHLAPIMFESGARPHPAQDLYQAYLSQSHIFIGIYWQSYGWIGPEMKISGLEDEYNRTNALPRLIYIKKPSPQREDRLTQLLERIRGENASSYKYFSNPDELRELVENDLILLLTEYFETVSAKEHAPEELTPAALTNVPIPRNPLIGREVELESAFNLLQREDVALVTLTGPAGTGKSRLGIQIALDLRDQFEDGVFMVALENIKDPELVIPTIAKTLNITETTSGLALFDLLVAQLNKKQMLLLLDNFEQILGAAPEIANLLESCPLTKILVTSRAPLHLRAEKELPIPPLRVPPHKDRYELEPLSQYSAVELFIQRCQAVKADFKVTHDNASAIAEICQQLDGLPLALELAAARIKLMPPKVLLSRLGHRFEILRGGTIDLPERQQTMYGAIDWSYSLLEDNEKRLLQHLSVFRGGWTVEAAIAVCEAACQSEQKIMDSLEMLVDNNLIRLPDETSNEPRLRMLESIRKFAYERLEDSGESEAIHQSHAEYYASMAQQAEKEKFGSKEQFRWRMRLEAELDNMRMAMDSALDRHQYACELRIATGLWRFWWTHGYWREGIHWIELGLAGESGVPGEVRAKALTRMGWMLNKVGYSTRGIESLKEAVALWRTLSNPEGLALALSNLGGVMVNTDSSQAITILEEALKIRRGLIKQPGVYATMMNLGIALVKEGQEERAIDLFVESLVQAREVNDDYSKGITLINLGDVYTNRGNYEDAEACFHEAEVIYKNLGDRTGMADVIRGRGRIALLKGEPTRALELLSKACGMAFEMEIISQTLVSIEGIAFAAEKLHNPIKATRLLCACTTIRNEMDLNRIPSHKADCEAYLDRLQRLMSEISFAQAKDEGSKMSLNQVVAYALRKEE
jgi:predicted ATPase